jgi:hypothetical protein
MMTTTNPEALLVILAGPDWSAPITLAYRVVMGTTNAVTIGIQNEHIKRRKEQSAGP